MGERACGMHQVPKVNRERAAKASSGRTFPRSCGSVVVEAMFTSAQLGVPARKYLAP